MSMLNLYIFYIVFTYLSTFLHSLSCPGLCRSASDLTKYGFFLPDSHISAKSQMPRYKTKSSCVSV